MRTFLILLLSALLSLEVFAQDWKTVSTDEVKKALTVCASRYRSENYAIRFEQTLFKDAGKSDDVVKSTGTLLRGKGRQYRSEQGGQLIIQTNDIKLLIDSAQQIIGIIQPDTLFDLINVELLLHHQGWDQLTCRSTVSGKAIIYQLTGPGLSIYQSMELTIDQKTGYLNSLTLYFAAQNYFSESTGDETIEQPKVVIHYSLPTPLTVQQLKLFDVSAWVQKEKNTYQTTTASQGYTLQDYRYTEHR
jgi:hypothetical protein